MRTTAITTILGIVIASFVSGPAGADQRIEKIRELYKSAQELACGEGCEGNVHELRMSTVLAAIGLQVTDVRFYFTSCQAAPEKDPSLMDHALKMVAVTYNVAAGMKYRIEHLYDGKGNPVFCYWKEENEHGEAPIVSEKRYYFQGGQLIQVIVDVKDEETAPRKYAQTSNFKAGDIADAKQMLAKALRYRGLFKTVLQAEQWK
jgi:hypothetical protein